MESLRSHLSRIRKEDGLAGYGKVSAPSFRENLTDEQRDEAVAAGIGACWPLADEAE
jgi:hypothetical protein